MSAGSPLLDSVTVQAGDVAIPAENALAAAGKIGVDAVQFRLGDTVSAGNVSGAQASVVGYRLPPRPCTNGSGKDPTTAGIESVALQSCRSHQIRSPR